MSFNTFLFIALLLCAGCVAPVAGLYPAKPDAPSETIYVVNHGWHTGLVIPSRHLPESARPPWPSLHSSPFLEVGWGDDGFYRADRVTSGIALRAMFWRNPAVLHIVAVDSNPVAYFAGSGIIQMKISTNGFAALARYLAGSFGTNAAGGKIDLGKGIYGDSRFHRATGHYFFPNTCNKWTARALRSTGSPVSSFYAIRAENVFDQASKCGTVLHQLSDE